MTTHVWLSHPSNDIPWQCPAELADTYRDQLGWVDTDEPDDDAGATAEQIDEIHEDDGTEPEPAKRKRTRKSTGDS